MYKHKNAEIIEQFKWYYDNNYITARDGNAAYINGDGFVVTASGSRKNLLEDEDFIIVSEDGAQLTSVGSKKASIETGAHIKSLLITGTNSSVHVHSPNTVALAALFEQTPRTLEKILNEGWPELFRYTKVGYIVPFVDPGSAQLHGIIENAIDGSDIVIMQKHGVLAVGDSMNHCMEHIVRLEHISGILLKIVSASGGRLESIT